MDENERPETVGEVVTPMEGGEAEARTETAEMRASAGEERARQSHEENHRYQAARRSGERKGFERAMRVLSERQEQASEAERQQRAFIAQDGEAFIRRFPDVDLAAMDSDENFRRFCGSRYGRESLGDLYEDYLSVAGSVRQAAQACSESKRRRETGSGGGGSGEGLTNSQQRELDEWNRAYPQLKMSAKEYLSR